MDGAKDAASWLYQHAKASYDRREYADALEKFELCLRKLRDAHTRGGFAPDSFDSARTQYRHLDDYLELCRARESVEGRASASPYVAHAPTGAVNSASPLTTAPPYLVAPERSGSSGMHASHYSPPLKHPSAMYSGEGSWACDDTASLASLGGGAPDARTTLIMVCSPRNAPLPNLADEAVDVANETPSHVMRGGAAEELRNELLKGRYRAFLFAGHGDAELISSASPGLGGAEKRLTRTLGFTNQAGGLDLVRPETLAVLLGAHSPRANGALTTVFLNGCRTEEMGQRVRSAGVPYVVCWRTKAHNAAARTLARTFFASLAAGRGHSQAFDDARSAVLMVTRPGRLANGVASSVPAYELRDPFAPPDAVEEPGLSPRAAPDFSPPPMAAGLPILLGPNAREGLDPAGVRLSLG